MAYYLLNSGNRDAAAGTGIRERATAQLRARMWGVAFEEPHREALAAGDLALLYVGAPERLFIGRAVIGSPVHAWTPSEAETYPGSASEGVVLDEVVEWDRPVPMEAVLRRISPSDKNKADFAIDVVRITADEYQTTVDLATAP